MLFGCNDSAAVLRIQSERPELIDGICVELEAGGATRFGRRYALSPQLALPQTLTVLASGRPSAQAVVQGTRRGVEQSRARRQIQFQGGGVRQVDMPLTCAAGALSSARFEKLGAPAGQAALVIASPGESGAHVLAVGAGQSTRLEASIVGLAAVGGAPMAAMPKQLVVADLDGDCGRDVVVLGDAEPALWRSAASGELSAATLPSLGAMRAAASGDLNGDNLMDLVFVGGAQARVLAGDGNGGFREIAGAFDTPPGDATAVGLADLDGNGQLDVVIGQGATMPAAPLVYLNDPQGTGHFTRSAGSLAPRPERATAIAFADVDLDGDIDLAIAHAAGPVRLYLNRGPAFLEDRSFALMLPTANVDAPQVVFADLNGDCLPDLVYPQAGDAPLVLLNGTDRFTPGPAVDAPGATSLAVEDVTGDGLPDLIVAQAGGVQVLVQR